MNVYFERLKILWESMGYSDATKFARDIGYSRGENILRLKRNDNNEPGMMVLEDIVRKFPDFDFYFLLTGEKQKVSYQAAEVHNSLSSEHIEVYSCPDCIDRKKRIDELSSEISRLNEKISDKQETIEALKGHIKTLECKKETSDADSTQFRQAAKG